MVRCKMQLNHFKFRQYLFLYRLDSIIIFMNCKKLCKLPHGSKTLMFISDFFLLAVENVCAVALIM